MASTDGSFRAIFYAFLANGGIAIAKGIAAYVTGSGSMLAEAIHSVADCTNQVLLFVGLKGASRPADARHPLGYGKLTYFWSFMVAILLFSMGGLFSIYEGVHKLQDPEPLDRAWIALLVLGISIALEGGSLLGALREIKHLRKGYSLIHWLKHSRRAEMVVVFGEDVAALIGLVLASGFVGLAAITGNAIFDAMGSIAIGLVLITISVFLIVRVRALLIGIAAAPDLIEVIETAIADDDSVVEVFNVITIQFGARVVLAAKVAMRPELSIGQAAERLNRLEARIKVACPEIGWCFMEPDVRA
ncbi:MAG: cation diffusion facilitator family transporter [Spirochaetales bacterium]|nr:cation diffusion facilitator family transporter [Leptospiraceae bacterium]MCP5483109.1 cation diffusion facilitator family transporter [Spirochaetales bacterium]MCP5484549.1 cation diffusion facilitator family transporter [Spirochaetales bacterium]